MKSAYAFMFVRNLSILVYLRPMEDSSISCSEFTHAPDFVVDASSSSKDLDTPSRSSSWHPAMANSLPVVPGLRLEVGRNLIGAPGLLRGHLVGLRSVTGWMRLPSSATCWSQPPLELAGLFRSPNSAPPRPVSTICAYMVAPHATA